MLCSVLVRAYAGVSRHVSHLAARNCMCTSAAAAEYDIVISGGGMVGASLAASLSHRSVLCGRRVAVLDEGAGDVETPGGEPSEQQEFSNRVVALNPSSVEFLKSFGAWNNVARAKPVKRLMLWEECSDAYSTFENDGLAPDVAFVAENGVILSAILNAAGAAAENCRVEFVRNVKIQEAVLPGRETDGNVDILLEDSRTLTTKLLVGAEGVDSKVRQRMGVDYVTWNYDQTAVVAVVQLAGDVENNVAWQRFLTTGPLALLPLSDERSCVVWCQTPKNAETLVESSEEEFIDKLNEALWDTSKKQETVVQIVDEVLSKIPGLAAGPARQLPPSIMGVVADSRAGFPLSLGHAVTYAAPRVCLIGDSAHRMHPLAGLGANLGLTDAECLADKITQAATAGQDLGSMRHLKEYERERQKVVIPTMVAVEALYHIYRTDLTPVVMARSVALNILNSVPDFKKFVLKQTLL